MRTYAGKVILVVLLTALGAGLAFWGCSKKNPTAPTVPKLYIWSLPDSATLDLDGLVQTAKTPLTIQTISAGQHVVKCTYGRFSGVDTVEVHSGRTKPDTSFCQIPGVIYVTSVPDSAGVRFLGRHGAVVTGMTPGLWSSALSDTYQVVCSLSTTGYFKVVDTLRIWADSTARCYILPPTADSVVVWGHTASGWQRGGPFRTPDSIVVEYYLSRPTPLANLPFHCDLYWSNQLADTVTFFLGLNQTYVGVLMTGSFPGGSYALVSYWPMTPHALYLPVPNWSVTTYLLGEPMEPGRVRLQPQLFHRRRL